MLVIFDMDGVLVESEPVILKAAMAALREFGVFARPEDFRDFIGAGEDRFVGGVAEKHGVPYRMEMKKRTYEIYHTLVEEELVVYPETKPALAKLSEAGFSLAIGSSADREKVDVNLKSAGIAQDLFCTIVSGDDVARKKPYPDLYLEVARRAGVSPAQCVVVEDALNGIQAARAAGMRALAVTTSFPRQALLTAGADVVAENLMEIAEILQEPAL